MVSMKLFKKLVRDIQSSIGQFMAIVLVIAVGAFFYAGLITYSGTLSAYAKSYFKEHNLSDINVYYNQISLEDAAGLSRIDGINKIEARYTLDATQSFEGYKAFIKIHSIPANNEINTPALVEGNLPTTQDEILLDSHYAKEHQLRTGDQIRIRWKDNDYRFRISGLGENVEYAKKNDIQDHKTYGFGYIAEQALSPMGIGRTYNELMIDTQEGYDPVQLGSSIEAQSKHLSYVSQLGKERALHYSKLIETIHNNNLMSKVIPLFLFLIGAVILFLTMSRMVDSQRNQVGIMKALGVHNKTILLHYMGYPMLVGSIGSILGYCFAAFVFIPMVTESSARSYSLPGIQFTLSFFTVLPPILFSSAFGLLSCYLSGRIVLSENAAQAMRPKPPKKVNRLLIEKIPGLWRRIPYQYKLILRNILLNKRKALVSSVGVIASTVLLITAFGTNKSLLQVASQTQEVYVYDLRADYAAGASIDTSKLPTGVNQIFDLADYPVEFMKDGKKEKATLTVTDQANTLIRFFDDKNQPLSLKDTGVLVPKSYADKYHIREGDLIRVMFAAPEFHNKMIELKVAHISTQYMNPSFYCTPAYFKSFGLDYRPSSLFVKADSPADLPRMISFFEQDPHVDKLTDRKDLKESAQYILKQNRFVFVMFILCAVILSFSAIYTISSINIYERNRELATLKVLGYQKNKINRLIFLENIILTAFAVLVALPVSGYMYRIIVKALSSSHQQIPDQLHPSLLLAAVGLAFLLTTLANLLLRRKVSRINMMESLKSIG